MNDKMREYLGITEKNSRWENLLAENIFFMIPYEEQEAFQADLERISASEEHIEIEHQLQRSDGTRITLIGWMSTITDKNGAQEYSIIYSSAPEKEDESVNVQDNAYFLALEQTYNVIFETDLTKDIIECIYGHETSTIGAIYDVRMTLESAKTFWLDNFILKEDHAAMQAFLDYFSTPWKSGTAKAMHEHFRLQWKGVTYQYLIVGVYLKPTKFLFCCRNLTQMDALNKNDETDTPKNSSESLPKGIFARTFGHFDLFVNGIPITFSSSKEKELMALLIDRNGGTLSTSEACTYLWEDAPADEKLFSRYRKLAMGLKKTLTKYGIEYILINHGGVRSIDVSAIQCDYYELLAGNEHFLKSFHNAYMTDYSWGEETLATLWDYS
jgi:hypothetical protein